MIYLKQGNILEADVQAFVNPVNCVGVMGKGLALQFKQAFPENYAAYVKACREGQIVIGDIFIVNIYPSHPYPKLVIGGRVLHLVDPKIIMNFATKRNWTSPSRLSYITTGLVTLIDAVRGLDIESIAIPALGCGLGGLDWAGVRPAIEEAFSELPEVKVLLYEPQK